MKKDTPCGFQASPLMQSKSFRTDLGEFPSSRYAVETPIQQRNGVAHLRKFAVIFLSAMAGSLINFPATAGTPEPFTPESMLRALVQIAVQEDLVDEKSIGQLLGFEIVLETLPSYQMDDGRVSIRASGSVSKDPGYFLQTYDNFLYRQSTAPMRRAGMTVKFDSTKLCINPSDLYEQFKKYGAVGPVPPPIEAPSPPGFTRSRLMVEQPVYGYWFTGQRSSMNFRFSYTKCLLEVHVHQPKSTQ